MRNTRIFWMGIMSLSLVFISYVVVSNYRDESKTHEVAAEYVEVKHEKLLDKPIGESRSTYGADNNILQEQVLSLRKDVAQLRLELNSLKQAGAPKATLLSDVKTPEEHKNSLLDPAKKMDAELNHRGEMAVIESAFRAESRNSQWAAEASSQIRNLLDNNQIPQANLHNIECRSKTCRVEFSGSKDDVMQSLPSLFTQLSPSLPSIMSDHIDMGNGFSTMVLYLSAAQ